MVLTGKVVKKEVLSPQHMRQQMVPGQLFDIHAKKVSGTKSEREQQHEVETQLNTSAQEIKQFAQIYFTCVYHTATQNKKQRGLRYQTIRKQIHLLLI